MKKKKLLTEQERERKIETTLLEEKESKQFECESHKRSNKRATNSKRPIVPILIGFILGGLVGKLLILILKVMGIL